MNKLTVVGFDPGNGAGKVWAAAGGVEVPNQVALPKKREMAAVEGTRGMKRPLTITVDGQAYLVGINAHSIGEGLGALDYERLEGTPEMRALFYGSMSQYMKTHKAALDKPIMLMVGLPLAPLSESPRKVNATKRTIEGWLLGRHEWLCGKKKQAIEIGKVVITSQVAAVYWGAMLDLEGSWTPEGRKLRKQEIGVELIGLGTHELYVAQGGVKVERFIGSSENGVRRLLKLTDPDDFYTIGELDSQLRQGQLNTSAAKPLWLRSINNDVDKQWGRDWKRFGAIVGAGGGVLQAKQDLANRYNGKMRMASEPILAVAQGMYAMGMMLAKKGK